MATFEEIVRAPRLKVERAKYHIRDAHRQIQAYISERPLYLVIEHNPNLGERLIRIKTDKPVPPAISLTIGDAVHNLRSALDVLIFGMVGSRAARPELVQFPIARRPESLEQTIATRYANLAGKNVVDKIRALKPYPGGNEYLSGLHDLDIRDKHKLIITIARYPKFSFQDLYSIDPELLGGKLPGFSRDNVVLMPHGDVVYRYSVAGKVADPSGKGEVFEWKANINPAVHVLLDDGQPFGGENISLTMVNLGKYVSDVISELGAAYIRSNP